MPGRDDFDVLDLYNMPKGYELHQNDAGAFYAPATNAAQSATKSGIPSASLEMGSGMMGSKPLPQAQTRGAKPAVKTKSIEEQIREMEERIAAMRSSLQAPPAVQPTLDRMKQEPEDYPTR